MIEEKFALATSDASTPIVVALYEAQAEHRELGTHSHARGQLSGLRRGLLTMGTDAGALGRTGRPCRLASPSSASLWMDPWSRRGMELLRG